MLLSAVAADGRWAWHRAAPSVCLMGGCEMADDKGTALVRRSRSAPKVVSPRNTVTVAFPFSNIAAEEPAQMRAGDWISLAGLLISVIGYSVAIRQLTRIANALEADRANREEADRLAGRSSSSDVGSRIS